MPEWAVEIIRAMIVAKPLMFIKAELCVRVRRILVAGGIQATACNAAFFNVLHRLGYTRTRRPGSTARRPSTCSAPSSAAWRSSPTTATSPSSTKLTLMMAGLFATMAGLSTANACFKS